MPKQQGKGGGSPIPKIEINVDFSQKQGEELLATLQARFSKHMNRHQDLAWTEIQAKLEAHTAKLSSLHAMENTGGEPDVVGFDPETGEYIFYDCAAQSPIGRRKICYDRAAEKEREKKGVHLAGNALDLAAAMGIELLNEDQYRALQQLGEFDTTTSSWIATPPEIRKEGGAIFADRRYDHIFVYHNSAPSFYSARGFRGRLRV
jgi:hypothetical protein